MQSKNSGLNIGAARVKIDIPDDFFPYRSFYGRMYKGLHDDLHARCIIIGNGQTSALILSIELGDLGDIDMWLEKVSKASGVPVNNIFITVTHTHEAPHVSDSFDLPVADVEKTRLFGECVWQTVDEAVQTARKNMKPGRIAYGTGQCYVNVNRDFEHKGKHMQGPNPHGPSDKTVVVIKFEDLKGEVIAYFFNYAVHGSVWFYLHGGMLVSSDLPGAASRYIEKRHDDKVVALFTSGAAGDQNARYMANRLIIDSKGDIKEISVKEAGYLLVEVQGEALADEVLLAAANIQKTISQAKIKGIQKKVTVPGQKKVEDQVKGFSVPNVLMPHSDIDNPVYFEDADPVTMHLSLLLIDHIAFVGIPGEPVCNLGAQVKDVLPYKDVVLVTHCNGSVSYISDEEGYERRTFAASASHIKRGYAEKALIQGTKDMFAELEN